MVKCTSVSWIPRKPLPPNLSKLVFSNLNIYHPNVCLLLDNSSDLTSLTNESQSFVMEAVRMTDLNHPNVMNLLGICWSPNSENVRYTSPLVVLPYMMLGDLRTYLRGKRIKTAIGVS